MQKAPDWKGSGLKPVEENKSNEEIVHVFGRNLEERVINKEDDETPSISFGTPEQSKEKEQDDDDIESFRKRKFDAITGEEDEETVFQGDFKLFIWDLESSNWREKGRGLLKLNDSIDSNKKKSRLIMRLCGTLRILLNVSINRSFFKVIANTKTIIRFTDSQHVWAASGSNAQQLRDLIDQRLGEEPEETDSELRKKVKASDSEQNAAKEEKDSPSKEKSVQKEDLKKLYV